MPDSLVIDQNSGDLQPPVRMNYKQLNWTLKATVILIIQMIKSVTGAIIRMAGRPPAEKREFGRLP